jgi:hypothetical protein
MSLAAAGPQPQTQGGTSWQSLGPAAVQSQNFGLVTGRISSLALDPSDPGGNTLYVGTTGGGVWRTQDAVTSSPANITFIPLTDTPSALSYAYDASISIGALSVQPGETGVILAGTGDPNDALDSYYGAGLLRSTDGGNTWSLIHETADEEFDFEGVGFAGFAWSTVNTQLVVAAISEAYEGFLVNGVWIGASCSGLFYSLDGGATWSIAVISDGKLGIVQGPTYGIAGDGNAATSVVWNPVRQVFVAAVRYHGYYESTDGVTFTRMTNQPGPGLAESANKCPTNTTGTGSTGCPIFRGTLAVNPQNGDTFAWTVDVNNQDQGIWQDVCAPSAGACSNQTITFAQQWNTTALETNTTEGAVTIEDGDYTLALAAVPSGQETMLLAGDDDLWKTDCPVSQGCQWRNTTNSTVGFCSEVGEYQHALAWNAGNPQEIFVGNDSGLWRSTDGIAESGTPCSPSDASHFANLNGSLGSLAEVVSMSQVGATPYTMMAGLGVNGTAGVKSITGPTVNWPEILGAEGGPVAIDPGNSANWYVNTQTGVSIHLCSQQNPCTPAVFGTSAVVTDADVGEDGLTMTSAAPFLVDPLNNKELLIGTCRLWRGPANGIGWSNTNAITPFLDGATGKPSCNGDALIRSIAAMVLPVSTALPQGGEVIYLGMYGYFNGGRTLPGHILSVTINPASSAPAKWIDLTRLNPVTNEDNPMNYYEYDVSSIFIDPHDTTGQTVYVTIAGFATLQEDVQTLYRSIDGGEHWTVVEDNLPEVPANSVIVDPEDANTVYVGTDTGVYSTRLIGSCVNISDCWSAFGSGLPRSPVVQISASPASATTHELVAATYGRGIWMTSLWTSEEVFTTATATPASLTFASQMYGTPSNAQTVTLSNAGSATLTPTGIGFGAASAEFTETDNCLNQSLAGGASCTIQVTFTPGVVGSVTSQMTIYGNLPGGQMTVPLSGIGTSGSAITLSPVTVDFGSWMTGISASTVAVVTANNSSATAVPVAVAVSGPFSLTEYLCNGSVPAKGSCTMDIAFTPLQAGEATGMLTFTDADGTQTVALSAQGETPAQAALSATSLTFPGTIIGQLSPAQIVTLTDNGGSRVALVGVAVSGPFVESDQCTSILPADASCAISVTYAPSQAGVQTGSIVVSDTVSSLTVTLSGTGLTAPVVGVNPASLTFAGQSTGQPSPPQIVTVTNTGGAPMAKVGFQITGGSATSFSYGSTTCGSILTISSSCTVQVVFTPAEAGESTALLVVSSSTPGTAAVTVPLTGIGLNPGGLNVNPAQLGFPTVKPGQLSLAETVTVTNTGTSLANTITLSVTSPFSLVQNTCISSLAGGASCSTGVVFSPQLDGNYTGYLTIVSPTQGPISVPLSGIGGVPGTVLSQPEQIEFSEVGIGQSSSPVTVTFTNPGLGGSLTNLTLTVTTGFQLVNNTCASALAGGASCTVGVEFVPLNAGVQSGSLTVGNSVLATAAVLPLSGTGFDFSVVPSGSINQTIANGQIAEFKLSITPLMGSQGAFTFQCGSLPLYASCTFNPTSMAITPNSSGYAEVEIATGLSQASARSSRMPVWPILPLACGLVLAPFALARRLRALMAVALLAILVGGVSSCATSGVILGGQVPISGPGFTPAGTYAIPVTAISNGVQHQVTITVIVD